MLNDIGSFAAVWLICWVVLGLLFAAFYNFLRPVLMRLHPRNGSALLLIYLACPLALSLMVALVMFMPEAEAVLVGNHCHEDCLSHAPLLDSTLLASFGIVCLLTVIGALALRSTKTLMRSLQLHKQFEILAKSHAGYCLMKTDTPMVFTLGWLNPVVYVSDALLRHCSEKDLAVILSHENAHKTRLDNLRLLAAHAFSAGLPYEIVRKMSKDLAMLTEQACDFKAAEQYGYLEVAEVLLKIKRILLRYNQPVPIGAQGFAESQVEDRVKALLEANKKVALNQWQIAGFFAFTVFCVLMLVDPMHHAAEWLFGLTG